MKPSALPAPAPAEADEVAVALPPLDEEERRRWAAVLARAVRRLRARDEDAAE